MIGQIRKDADFSFSVRVGFAVFRNVKLRIVGALCPTWTVRTGTVLRFPIASCLTQSPVLPVSLNMVQDSYTVRPSSQALFVTAQFRAGVEPRANREPAFPL